MKQVLSRRPAYAGLPVFLVAFVCALSPIHAQAASITWSDAGTESVAPGSETAMFGARTREALKRFQEASASEVLAPIGLTSGTGVFAEMSRKAMNGILASDTH